MKSENQVLQDSIYCKFPIVNIRIGPAKNIKFSWLDINIPNLVDYLIEMNPSKKDFCEISEQCLWFTYESQTDSYLVRAEKVSEESLQYMLPATVLNEIFKSENYGSYSEKGPYIFLKITGQDIQNNQFEELILFKFKRLMYKMEDDKSGKATYQVIPTLPEV